MASDPTLNLTGFTFEALFQAEGLMRLDQAFLNQLNEEAPSLHPQLLAYRQGKSALTSLETSDLLIGCAKVLESFLGRLFDIEDDLAISQAKTQTHNPIAVFKKYYILRRAKKELSKADAYPSFAELNDWLKLALDKASLTTEDPELALALLGTQYLAEPEKHQHEIDMLVKWCVRALTTPEGRAQTSLFVSFRLPERIDHMNLVRTEKASEDKFGRLLAPADTWRLRDGFALTDPRMNERQVQDEVNYCIYCHDHDGDFCSKGFPVKKGDKSQGFKKNPLNTIMTGCPLEEKISEMHMLKKDGFTLGALAMVMVDNPMCPATGHRICNDCMKACIYQKQDPVNIPQIETRVLIDVLNLPWGVELYDLLTRWNPLRQRQWVMQPYNGLKVLIAGMGPAGFTLAHHLLQEGLAVVGFDGLKIEPLPSTLVKKPIHRYADLTESLSERLMAGFGGVAEYGITVRWDKNFLKLIYLSLSRRPYFQVFGSVRFGGTVTIEDAWEMGFHHVAVAVGAGLPKALPIPYSLAPGMRQANDFLMALQLGNAAKSESLTNLQIRLPAVVIGGGLTGVDTATELQAYYITQVEKILSRYNALIKAYGEEVILAQIDQPSRQILAEYLRHGEAVSKERARAKAQGEKPNFIKLVHEWGGVTIAYRRSMQESPAYINNHEELSKALEEGIYYLEGLEPVAVDLDEYGHSQSLICQKRMRDQNNEWISTNETLKLSAHSILVATGTQPNTAYEFEHRGTFNRLNLQYQHYEEQDGELAVAHGVEHCKDERFGPFTSYRKDAYRVSLIGDTHPVFHGSVVKAIASGLRTYPKILSCLRNELGKEGDINEYHQFSKRMHTLFDSHIHAITRKTHHALQLTIHAPLAAKHFKAGQFYRLQNYETQSLRIHHTLLQMEPLALIAAACDKSKGLLTFIVSEETAAARLCSLLKPGERVALMGPTGVRAKIPNEHETVLIIGNASTFAFARSYGLALRAKGNRVIYLAQLAHPDEAYCQSELEESTDIIIWQTQTEEMVHPHRPQDLSLTGDDIIAALLNYANQDNIIPLMDIDRIFITGGSTLLRQFQAARKTTLKDHLIKDPKVFGSVYGNMQCMMKGVCAQCLQWQIDPETGQRTKAVFACSWQDQPLEIIDIDHIDARLLQNHVHEKLNRLWVDHLFNTQKLDRI